jgi:hypothetical protein
MILLPINGMEIQISNFKLGGLNFGDTLLFRKAKGFVIKKDGR